MTDPIYKQIRITGTSTVSIEDAVNKALARASKSVRLMRWFVIQETRGSIADGQVQQWQVTLEIGFTLEDEED